MFLIGFLAASALTTGLDRAFGGAMGIFGDDSDIGPLLWTYLVIAFIVTASPVILLTNNFDTFGGVVGPIYLPFLLWIVGYLIGKIMLFEDYHKTLIAIVIAVFFFTEEVQTGVFQHLHLETSRQDVGAARKEFLENTVGVRQWLIGYAGAALAYYLVRRKANQESAAN